MKTTSCATIALPLSGCIQHFKHDIQIKAHRTFDTLHPRFPQHLTLNPEEDDKLLAILADVTQLLSTAACVPGRARLREIVEWLL